MTTLANPTVVGERPYSNSWCGQAAAASVATDFLGRTVLPPEIDANIPASLRISNGTTGAGLTAALNNIHVPARHVYGVAMQTYVPQCLGQKFEFIMLHQCNGYAQPVAAGSTRIAHWRTGYGNDNNAIQNMNPWLADLESTSWPSMADADLRECVVINGVMQKDGGAVADLGAGYWQGVAVATSALLGRTRENDPPGTDTDAAVAGDLINNPNDFINQVHGITTSPEFQNRFAGLKWIVDNLTDGNSNVDPAKLAAALGSAPAPAPPPIPVPPAPLPNAADLLAAINTAVTSLQALAAQVQKAGQ